MISEQARKAALAMDEAHLVDDREDYLPFIQQAIDAATAELREKNEMLLDALETYGEHLANKDHFCSVHEQGNAPCDCGLNDIFRRARNEC